MDITVQIKIKGTAGELSIPERNWQLRFGDQHAGYVAVYRLCEEGILATETGSRFLMALERSRLPKEGTAGITIYENGELKMYTSEVAA